MLLAKGVIDIRKFFQEKNSTDFINTSMLRRHALAFGLYLAGTTADSVALCIKDLSDDDRTLQIQEIVSTTDFFIQFLSQLLLCQIIYTWSTKNPDQLIAEQAEESAFPAIVLTDFDENFDLMARMWNCLVAQKLKGSEANKTYIVTAQSFQPNSSSMSVSQIGAS